MLTSVEAKHLNKYAKRDGQSLSSWIRAVLVRALLAEYEQEKKAS